MVCRLDRDLGLLISNPVCGQPGERSDRRVDGRHRPRRGHASHAAHDEGCGEAVRARRFSLHRGVSLPAGQRVQKATGCSVGERALVLLPGCAGVLGGFVILFQKISTSDLGLSASFFTHIRSSSPGSGTLLGHSLCLAAFLPSRRSDSFDSFFNGVYVLIPIVGEVLIFSGTAVLLFVESEPTESAFDAPSQQDGESGFRGSTPSWGNALGIERLLRVPGSRTFNSAESCPAVGSYSAPPLTRRVLVFLLTDPVTVTILVWGNLLNKSSLEDVTLKYGTSSGSL
jgi:hypothetical protein